MALSDLPAHIIKNYEVHEWRHAVAILQHDFPQEYQEMVNCLGSIKLTSAEILAGGGGKSSIASAIDSQLYGCGWMETKFDTSIVINGVQKDTPTHSIDCYKNRIALEVEWNNKTEFYDRDLNNFRLLHDRDVISVGVIITRASELQFLFNELGKGKSYGASSTHMDKLVPRIDGGSGGGCPILIFGIKNDLYDDVATVAKIKKEQSDKESKKNVITEAKVKLDQKRIEKAAKAKAVASPEAKDILNPSTK